MDRRRLLIGLMAIAAAQMTACQSSLDNGLEIAALKGVLSPEMIQDFKASLEEAIAIKVRAQDSLVALFQQLQLWHQPAPVSAPRRADWALLSDYWLLPAIQQGLISPLDNADTTSGWQTLPEIWPRLLQRNSQGLLSETGSIWGTPYRWGHLMMVYDHRPFRQLGWEPTAWADLLKPELQHQIALPEHPRLVLGIILKALNYSANDPHPESHAELLSALEKLRSQVKVYATTTYLQSLVIGDVVLAVGWSNDIQPLLPRYRYLRAVAPLPGTLLSADIWTKPTVNSDVQNAIALSSVEQSWLSYWWQPEAVTSLNLLAQGLSPLLLSDQTPDFSFDLSATTVMPTTEQLQQSEFVEPLDDKAIANYNELWLKLRGSK